MVFNKIYAVVLLGLLAAFLFDCGPTLPPLTEKQIKYLATWDEGTI